MPRIEGQIGYFQLGDWWLSTFSTEERKHIEQTFQPMALGASSTAHGLTKGKVTGASVTKAHLLSTLAGWFIKRAEDRSIARRLLVKAEEIGKAEKGWIDLHFIYMHMVQCYYKDRETDPTAFDLAVTACEKQIAIAHQVIQAFKSQDPPWWPLPAHTGFEQLAVIREKQQDFSEATRLCKLAKEQGWAGDWDKRIERCEKRAAQLKKG